MLFTLPNLNSNLTLTLGYLNPVLNNSAPEKFQSSTVNPRNIDAENNNKTLNTDNQTSGTQSK